MASTKTNKFDFLYIKRCISLKRDEKKRLLVRHYQNVTICRDLVTRSTFLVWSKPKQNIKLLKIDKHCKINFPLQQHLVFLKGIQFSCFSFIRLDCYMQTDKQLFIIFNYLSISSFFKKLHVCFIYLDCNIHLRKLKL